MEERVLRRQSKEDKESTGENTVIGSRSQWSKHHNNTKALKCIWSRINQLSGSVTSLGALLHDLSGFFFPGGKIFLGFDDFVFFSVEGESFSFILFLKSSSEVSKSVLGGFGGWAVFFVRGILISD
jgi:hypothetical protein